ncbi:MAG: SMC-Scp complex subunit ScpB [Pseudomonadales bacterium]
MSDDIEIDSDDSGSDVDRGSDNITAMPPIKQIVEGAILAADRPLSIDQMISLFETGQPARADLREVLAEIEKDCDGRGFELKQVASGYRFQVRQDYGEWVGRLWEERPPRYSRALLETLALIAYKQPITRGDIEEIRGVAVSTNIMRSLLEREWVRVVGHRDVPGRPAIYATTKTFLDYFNLDSLDELPTLSDIKDLDKMNEELNLEEDLIEIRSLELNEGEQEDTSGIEDVDLEKVTEKVNAIQDNIRKLFVEEEPENDLDDEEDEPVSTADSDDGAGHASEEITSKESTSEQSASEENTSDENAPTIDSGNEQDDEPKAEGDESSVEDAAPAADSFGGSVAQDIMNAAFAEEDEPADDEPAGDKP